MSFIEININNFNEGANNTSGERFIGNDSTLNKNLGNSIEANSFNATSLTNSIANNQSGVNIEDIIKRKTLIREIFIAATGTVLGSLTTYAIMNFLR